jgi:uncharacterized protein (TIGR02145 family)
MRKKSLLMTIVILNITVSSIGQVYGTFKDSRDGKNYKTVLIGTQTWIAENLAWKTESGCFAYDNNESNVKTYGYLYNWETATKACPSGWHLPSEKEWAILTTYLGGDSIAHIELKETGTIHWKEEDSTVTNKSGFTALPGGLYSNNSFKNKIEFKYIGNYGYWWSATTEPGERNYLNACFRTLGDYYKNEKLDYASKNRGSSVRCIKD